MNKELLLQIIEIEVGIDYGGITARVFEDMISSKLSKYGEVKRQVSVKNRGDGRKGRIDLIFTFNGIEYPIEIDRKKPRNKSIYKVKNYNKEMAFIILRSPFKIIEIF